MIPVEKLSKRARAATPDAFARYLVASVRAKYGVYLVAALWLLPDTVYRNIDGVLCFDERRDAYTYAGPHPIIAHPPCGPHGRYHHRSRQDRQAGYHALTLADTYGGVVEQPASSRLFRGGELVRQHDYGHPSEKLTRLYWGRARLPY
jgi:hypothetical protein